MQNKAHQPVLIIMSGLPFSGKTTLAKAIQVKFDMPRIDLDEINTNRGLGINAVKISDDEWQETYNISYLQSTKLLAQGQSHIYDAINFTRQQRQKLISIAHKADAAPTDWQAPSSSTSSREPKNRRKIRQSEMKTSSMS